MKRPLNDSANLLHRPVESKSHCRHLGQYLRVTYRASCGKLLRLPLGRSLDLSVKLPSAPEFVLAVSGAR